MNRPASRPRIVVQSPDPRLRALIGERLADLGEVVAVADGRGAGAAAVVQAEGDDGAEAAGGPPGPAASLTPRELEVLGLCAEGLANKEIADRLGVSAHTAKFHVESLLHKLGAANRAGAVKEGIRQGLISV
jgi:DNA-binding CsgD family transcriptional regulator